MPSIRAGDPRRPWSAVHNWVYWLDAPDLRQIDASNFELAVIDYSADGTAQHAFTSAQIEALRRATCRRRVVAYLSIGEAESYRWYWQPGHSNQSWIVTEDADWPGNFWVRYWYPAWQSLIYQYLDKILAAGFDGVYLDRVDAYAERYAAGHKEDMIAFVRSIARYARLRSPLGEDFGIIVQNAEELATSDPDYVALVTGIGREEVYVRATNQLTSPAERATAEAYLNLFRQRSRGRLVLTVDYANRPDIVSAAYAAARARGFVPYVTDVSLNRIPVNPGYEPVCTAIPQTS